MCIVRTPNQTVAVPAIDPTYYYYLAYTTMCIIDGNSKRVRLEAAIRMYPLVDGCSRLIRSLSALLTDSVD